MRNIRGGLAESACVIVRKSMRDIDLPCDRARWAAITREEPDSAPGDGVSMATIRTNTVFLDVIAEIRASW